MEPYVEGEEKLAEEVSEETEEQVRNEFSYTEYKEIQDMLKSLRDMTDFCKKTVMEEIQNTYGLDPEIVNTEGGILGYTKTDISAMTYGDVVSILDKYGNAENTKRIIELERDEDQSETDAAIKLLQFIKDQQIVLIENERQYLDGVNQAVEIGRQYREFLSSDAYKKKRDRMLEQLEAAAAAETDESKQRAMYKKIALFKDTLSLDFFTRRIIANPKKEKQSIMKGFFHEEQGKYVVDKFRERVEKFGYNQTIFQKFYNLEELFLPEEYRVYNNLFLFMYMRFVAYANPYSEESKSYVKALTTNIVSLIYHQFTNKALEDEFIDFIKGVLDLFAEDRAAFEEDNTSNPDHPVCIQNRREHERLRREKLIAKMDELKITGYDPDANADTLYKYMADAIDAMQSSQTPKGEKTNVEVEEATEENPDGHVTISPKMEEETPAESEEAPKEFTDDDGTRYVQRPDKSWDRYLEDGTLDPEGPYPPTPVSKLTGKPVMFGNPYGEKPPIADDVYEEVENIKKEDTTMEETEIKKEETGTADVVAPETRRADEFVGDEVKEQYADIVDGIASEITLTKFDADKEAAREALENYLKDTFSDDATVTTVDPRDTEIFQAFYFEEKDGLETVCFTATLNLFKVVGTGPIEGEAADEILEDGLAEIAPFVEKVSSPLGIEIIPSYSVVPDPTEEEPAWYTIFVRSEVGTKDAFVKEATDDDEAGETAEAGEVPSQD